MGHVDFTYEVSRALAACEGAILVVDAAQGIEAQTLANAYLAHRQRTSTIVPVINKIDLPAAEPERRRARDRGRRSGIPRRRRAAVSAPRRGRASTSCSSAIVERIPPPTGDPDAPLRALIFDSWFDPYRGVVVLLVRVVDGALAHRRAHPLHGDAARARGRPSSA